MGIQGGFGLFWGWVLFLGAGLKLLTSISGIVRIIACWAFVLGMLNLASVLILIKAIEQYTNEYGDSRRVWVILGLGIVFGGRAKITYQYQWNCANYCLLGFCPGHA